MSNKKQVFEINRYASVSAELLRFVVWVANTSRNFEKSLLKLVEHSLKQLISKAYFIEPPTISLYNFIIHLLKDPNYFSFKDHVSVLLDIYAEEIKDKLDNLDKDMKNEAQLHYYFHWHCDRPIDPLRVYLKYMKAYSIKFDNKFELTIVVNVNDKIVVSCKSIEDEAVYFEETFESIDVTHACSTFVGEYCFIMTELNNYLYRGNYIQGRLLTKDHRRYKEIKVMEDPVPLSATHEEQPYFKRHGFL